MCPESWWALPPTFKRGKILKTFFTQIHMHERNQGHHKWVLLSKFQYWACLIYYVQEKKEHFFICMMQQSFCNSLRQKLPFQNIPGIFFKQSNISTIIWSGIWNWSALPKQTFFKWNFPTKYSFYILCYQKMILYLLRPLR